MIFLTETVDLGVNIKIHKETHVKILNTAAAVQLNRHRQFID